MRLIASNRQYIHLEDLSEACITRPETRGPEGAAFTLWFKLGDFVDRQGIISSKSIGKSGFAVHCDFYSWSMGMTVITVGFALHSKEQKYNIVIILMSHLKIVFAHLTEKNCNKPT